MNYLYLALAPIVFFLGFLLWIQLDSISRANAYRKRFEEEERRKAARTPEQVEMDGRIACILYFGIDPLSMGAYKSDASMEGCK